MSLTDATPTEAAVAAKEASHTLATLPVSARNDALTAMHEALTAAKDEILAANAQDLELARKAAADGQLSPSLVSRLDLGKQGKWEDMLKGILDVRALDDPVGQVTLRARLDDHLTLERVSSPIGVLLVIFEARPEVLANIASLAIKSGNAALLKGGRESTASLVAMARALAAGLAAAAVPPAAVQLVTARAAIPQLLALDRLVDLVIPRGGADLVRFVQAHARIPVLGHADGRCAAYLEPTADPAMAARVLLDAKTAYPAACNALESLLVHEQALSGPAFARAAAALLAAGVELRCDAPSKAAALQVAAAAGGSRLEAQVVDAQAADFETEFLGPVLAVKTVAGLDEAVAHINAHGSHHTDAILTGDGAAAERFLAGVDSAGVYWNASTRFADGMRYGFGTEVGISTAKVHARGPVGLEGLMIYKYKLRGRGQVAAEYGDGDGQRRFLHERLPL